MTEEETTPLHAHSNAKWYSTSTWVALGILLLYCIFTFVFPIVPIAVVAASMEQSILYGVPLLALGAWMVAMIIRIRHRKLRLATVLWIGLRYALISLGTVGFVVMFVVMLVALLANPGYIRATNQFHGKMKKAADIEGIRTWAESYKHSADDKPTLWGGSVSVPKSKWPECIAKLKPQRVRLNTEDRVVDLMYGSGFGHWGLSVGPRGTAPQGDYVKPLEDGAWVWHEIQ